MLCDIYDMSFGMLLVRGIEVSVRKWSGGAAQLRSSEEELLLICYSLCRCFRSGGAADHQQHRLQARRQSNTRSRFEDDQ